MQKATKLNEIYKALSKEPLEINDLEAFYINTDKARGEKTRSALAILLEDNLDSYQHILFSGYTGCGKSTELFHLEKDIQDTFLVINFSIKDELDPQNFNYIELVIVTMERLFNFVKENNLILDPLFINDISSFLKIKVIEEIREKYMAAEIEAGVDINIQIPYISKFFTAFKGSMKNSSSLKTVLTEKVEPLFASLLNHCNNLILQISTNIPKKFNKKDLLLIIEGLDKAKLSNVEKLFYDHTEQITGLKTNIIFTFPIAMRYHSKINIISSYFDIYELPMIKIHNKKGEDDAEGIETMKKIINARIDLNLFENNEILLNFIRYSGGCLRDLFSMINDAAINGRIEKRTKINKVDEKHAYNRIKKDYKATISFREKDGVVVVSEKKYYETLERLEKSTNKIIDNSIEELHLRQNLTILGYNGEGWCDVHPIVKDILNDRRS